MVVRLSFLIVSLSLGEGRCARICKLVVVCARLFSSFPPLFSVLFGLFFVKLILIFVVVRITSGKMCRHDIIPTHDRTSCLAPMLSRLVMIFRSSVRKNIKSSVVKQADRV